MKAVLLIGVLLGLTSHAATYTCAGKEVSKGDAVKLLAVGTVSECVETREVIFNDKAGTIKPKPKAKAGK